MNFVSIPTFRGNYIRVLNESNGRCIIADPGEAAPVLTAIEKNRWQPEAILLTYHHQDHTGGVKQLHEKFPSIMVYGSVETQDKGVTQVVDDGGRLSVLGHDFSTLSTSDHTLGHICCYSEPYLPCGDIVFSSDCRRLFKGTVEQMYRSFMRIGALLEETPICRAHEYTLTNMKFALNILPGDGDINDYYHKVNELRAKRQKTLPITLENERCISLFLRVNDIGLIDKINQETNLQHSVARFAWLGSKKDDF